MRARSIIWRRARSLVRLEAVLMWPDISLCCPLRLIIVDRLDSATLIRCARTTHEAEVGRTEGFLEGARIFQKTIDSSLCCLNELAQIALLRLLLRLRLRLHRAPL